MDHRAFLKSLSEEDKARLTGLSDRKGLWHLAGHIGLLVVLAGYIGAQGPLWQAVLLPYGIALVFLFTLEHETTHRTPFAMPALNDWIGRACGVVLILPFEWFRPFHLAHHRFTNDPENDPELAGPRPDTWPRFVWHVSGFPYWRAMISQVWKNATGQAHAPWLSPRALPRIRRESRILLAIYFLAALSLFATDLILWLWLVPVLIGQPFLRLYLLAEHGRCAPVANMFENTRTTFTGRFIRFLAWNMPYHSEHHAYPAVPFWRLPELHTHTAKYLQVTEDGYVKFSGKFMRSLRHGTD